jgi:hypothetical protein
MQVTIKYINSTTNKIKINIYTVFDIWFNETVVKKLLLISV